MHCSSIKTDAEKRCDFCWTQIVGLEKCCICKNRWTGKYKRLAALLLYFSINAFYSDLHYCTFWHNKKMCLKKTVGLMDDGMLRLVPCAMIVVEHVNCWTCPGFGHIISSVSANSNIGQNQFTSTFSGYHVVI